MMKKVVRAAVGSLLPQRPALFEHPYNFWTSTFLPLSTMLT